MFIGTYENKVDRKSRVSVPAAFRQVLTPQSFSGIVAFASYRDPAVEACGYDFMQRLNESMTKFDLFSEPHDDLTLSIFAGSQPLPFDSEGRINLPPAFAEHAGIGDMAAFVGKGNTFQIWEPSALERHLAAARDRSRERGLTLPLRPQGGDGA